MAPATSEVDATGENGKDGLAPLEDGLPLGDGLAPLEDEHSLAPLEAPPVPPQEPLEESPVDAEQPTLDASMERLNVCLGLRREMKEKAKEEKEEEGPKSKDVHVAPTAKTKAQPQSKVPAKPKAKAKGHPQKATNKGLMKKKKPASAGKKGMQAQPSAGSGNAAKAKSKAKGQAKAAKPKCGGVGKKTSSKCVKKPVKKELKQTKKDVYSREYHRQTCNSASVCLHVFICVKLFPLVSLQCLTVFVSPLFGLTNFLASATRHFAEDSWPVPGADQSEGEGSGAEGSAKAVWVIYCVSEPQLTSFVYREHLKGKMQLAAQSSTSSNLKRFDRYRNRDDGDIILLYLK